MTQIDINNVEFEYETSLKSLFGNDMPSIYFILKRII